MLERSSKGSYEDKRALESGFWKIVTRARGDRSITSGRFLRWTLRATFIISCKRAREIRSHFALSSGCNIMQRRWERWTISTCARESVFVLDSHLACGSLESKSAAFGALKASTPHSSFMSTLTCDFYSMYPRKWNAAASKHVQLRSRAIQHPRDLTPPDWRNPLLPPSRDSRDKDDGERMEKMAEASRHLK
jgi:hypothetical protein